MNHRKRCTSLLTMQSSFLFIRGSSLRRACRIELGFDHAVDNEIGHIMRRMRQPFFPINHTHPCIPCTLSRLLLPTLSLVVNNPWDTRRIRPADNFVDPFTVRFAEDMPVARSPVLDRMLTIPMAGQAQTTIRRRVKVVHKTDYEDGSFVFVRHTPKRPTTLRGPPPIWRKRRVGEEENVTEEMKEEYGMWLKAKIVAAKPSAGAKKAWWWC
jgi:hypothetical protein